MDCCAICLKEADDARSCINIESVEWQKLNVQRIVEKHLWWWHLKQSSAKKSSYICRQCWNVLSSFHDFYMQVKKTHQEYDNEKWPVLKRSTLKGNCYMKGNGYKLCVENNSEIGVQINVGDAADIPHKKSTSRTDTRQHDKVLAKSGYQLYCDLCTVPLKYFVELKSHYRLEHNISGYALCCNKKFYNRKQFVKHLKAHNKPNSFKCSVCSLVLFNRFNYENHLKCHHSYTNQILVCDYDRQIVLHSKESGIPKTANKFGNSANSSESAGLAVTNSVSMNNSKNVSNTFVEKIDYTRIEDEIIDCKEELSNVWQNCSTNPFQNDPTKGLTVEINEQIPDTSTGIHAEPCFKSRQNEHITVSETAEINEISCIIKPENFVCSENGEIFNYTFIEEYSNHPNNYESPGCDSSVTQIYQKEKNYKIDEEYLKHAKYTVSCHLCLAPFESFFELKSHCRLCHNANGYAKCCNQKIYNFGKFADHLRVHENPNYFKCMTCGQILRHRTAYETHIQSHKHKKKEINCDICGKKFNNKLVLYRHQNIAHSREVKKEQICPYCSKVSSNMQAHRNHIRYNHTKGLKHACHLCEKKFNRPFHLREHLSIHTGVPLYACPYCSRPFKSKANLYSHRKKLHPKEWAEERIKQKA